MYQNIVKITVFFGFMFFSICNFTSQHGHNALRSMRLRSSNDLEEIDKEPQYVFLHYLNSEQSESRDSLEDKSLAEREYASLSELKGRIEGCKDFFLIELSHFNERLVYLSNSLKEVRRINSSLYQDYEFIHEFIGKLEKRVNSIEKILKMANGRSVVIASLTESEETLERALGDLAKKHQALSDQAAKKEENDKKLRIDFEKLKKELDKLLEENEQRSKGELLVLRSDNHKTKTPQKRNTTPRPSDLKKK